MTFRGFRLATAITVLSAGVASAAVQTYDCQIEDVGSNGFMSDRLILSFDTATGRARAIDGIINFYHGAPIDVQMRQRGNGNISFRWELRRSTSGKSDVANVNYSAMFRPSQNSVQIDGLVLGFDNDVRGRGACRAVQNHLF